MVSAMAVAIASSSSSSNFLLCRGVSSLTFLNHTALRRPSTNNNSKKWRNRSSPSIVSIDHSPIQPTATTTTNQSLLEQEEGKVEEEKNFDWNCQWYPVAIPHELDRRVPNAVRVLGKDLVVWWDRKGESWQVWDDKCPHRLAPLSEGRIDENGELQCSYHGWTFAPCSGSCTRIPQAPLDGKQVWKSQRACASIYPTVEQDGIIWFWPDMRPEFENIASSKRPPSIAGLGDPAFKDALSSRDLPYDYDHLIENLMDPAHVPFAHHGLQGNRNRAKPLNYVLKSLDKSGYTGDAEGAEAVFTAPCIFTINRPLVKDGEQVNKSTKRIVLVFICIPVSPGHSRVIWGFPRNFSTWIDNFIPRWFIHLRQMLVLDSDLYLLHLAERKIKESGMRWEEACYVPTSSDTFVITFRKWMRNYAGGGPDWGGRYENLLPPTQPKEQLMDRYLSHVKRCPDCSKALNFVKGLELFLEALSVGIAALLGAAAIKPLPQLGRWSLVLVIGSICSLVASRWLGHVIKKTYYVHDYNHGLVK